MPGAVMRSMASEPVCLGGPSTRSTSARVTSTHITIWREKGGKWKGGLGQRPGDGHRGHGLRAQRKGRNMVDLDK